jgi:N-acetylmuramoyl-L-alanine amidase
MPSVLVEIGFGSNPSEATWMASAKGQQSVADAIARSTRKYLDDYARRGGAVPGGR